MPSRKVTFKLYPNATERSALERTLGAHCKGTNTLIEMSRLRYKAGLPAYNRTSVNQATKAIRNSQTHIQNATLAQSLQVTGERVVRAFQAFFDRVARGETPGYPRFKSERRFSGFGFKAEGEGYRLIRKAVTRDAGPGYRYGAVALFGIVTEALSVSSMLTQPDKSSGLKRGVSDAAWASLLTMLTYKAEEAGTKFEQVPTTTIKPTRRCSGCGEVKTRDEMPLFQRRYSCACGFALPRDQNACRNMVRYAFEGAWWSG